MLGSLFVLPLIFAPLDLDGFDSDPIQTQIYGGNEVDSCGWPSAVYLQTVGGGACTGTLVHPLIVLTAAHCVNNASITNVRFGESSQTAMKLADTEYCKQNPGWTGATAQGVDYGYCKLKAPVTNVPIVPVAAGCEATAIRAGARIMHVGFGQDQDGNSGRKKMLDTVINSVTGSGEILSGTFSEIICNGDSGGPAFIYLDPAAGGDGTWRVAAIHSWAQGADPVDPNCNGQAGSVLVTQAIDWIESDSGVDITPCTDGDDWNPTAHCGGFPYEPWVSEGGSYPMGCHPGDVLPYSGVCGPALDESADATPPTVQILSPTNEMEFGGGSATVDIEVIANDEGGWGIDTVALTVRSVTLDMEQVEERNEFQPWSFSANLPGGAYEVEAVATDYAGNVSEPVTVCFGVGEPGCAAEDDDDSDTDTDTGGPLDTGEETAMAPEDDEGDESTGETAGAEGGGGKEGCGCRSASTPPAALWLLLLVGFRRRRG